MIQRKIFVLTKKTINLEISEKDYVGHTVAQFLLSTEYAFLKNQEKYLKLWIRLFWVSLTKQTNKQNTSDK